MFYRNQSANDRLTIWRELRQTKFSNIEDLVAEYKSIKLVSRYLDYYTPKSWPDPFEIVNQGYFCQSGVTLIMVSHLIYADFISSDVLEFPVISNNINGNDGLVFLDKDKVYNFEIGKISDWDFVKDNSTIFSTHKLKKDQFTY
tara:strand:+ start:3181 stop:3612 length:432 start_codon:yes stop_codon:yes gene_type:complete